MRDIRKGNNQDFRSIERDFVSELADHVLARRNPDGGYTSVQFVFPCADEFIIPSVCEIHLTLAVVREIGVEFLRPIRQ